MSRAEENKALAARIRGFVDAMPPITTRMQELKAKLAKQFSRTPEQEIERGPER